MVAVPSLIPKKPGERVKTNRRDGLSLARLLRAGELTAVWVPDERHEAMRDLSRARLAAHKDLRGKRQQLRFWVGSRRFQRLRAQEREGMAITPSPAAVYRGARKCSQWVRALLSHARIQGKVRAANRRQMRQLNDFVRVGVPRSDVQLVV